MPSSNSILSTAELRSPSLAGFRRAVRRVANTLHISLRSSPVKQAPVQVDSSKRRLLLTHQNCLPYTSMSTTSTSREDSVISPDGTEHCPAYLIRDSRCIEDSLGLCSTDNQLADADDDDDDDGTPGYQPLVTTVAVVETRPALTSVKSSVPLLPTGQDSIEPEEGPPTAKSLLNGSSDPTPTGITHLANAIETSSDWYDAIQLADAEKASEPKAVQTITEPVASSLETDAELALCRVYKKLSANGKLTLYLTSRDLVVTSHGVSPLHGVVHLDPEEVRGKKVFAQISLTFRYGRDDEEVMGLKLSNESIICLETIFPPPKTVAPRGTETKMAASYTPEQLVLLRRLGSDAYAFTLQLNRVAPPSVRLLPAKEYHGAAIGISYDLRIYVGEGPEERPSRRSQIRMIIRLVQYAPEKPIAQSPPSLATEKHYLLSEGKVRLHVQMDKHLYAMGDPIHVTTTVTYGVGLRSRTPRKIRILAMQHVDVSMFSNGKFKNIIADQEVSEGLTNAQGIFCRTFALRLDYSGTKQWVALEDRYGRLTPNLASTTLKATPDERNFFAIYVSYYVKVRLSVQGVGSDVMAKVPFLLMKLGPDLPSELLEPQTFASKSHHEHLPPVPNDDNGDIISLEANDNEASESQRDAETLLNANVLECAQDQQSSTENKGESINLTEDQQGNKTSLTRLIQTVEVDDIQYPKV